YDYWTGEHYSGPKSINVRVTLASIPIFVRGGAFIFTQPVVQHTGEMPGQPLIVEVFPSADSERSFYEDAGNGFGPSVRRKFALHGNTIEVGTPEGSYRPPARSIIFNVHGKDGVVTKKMPDRFERVEIPVP